MPTSEGAVKSARETLVAAHISAIAVAVLLFFSLEFAVRALSQPFPSVAGFVATAIAVRGMPYISHRTSLSERVHVDTCVARSFLGGCKFCGCVAAFSLGTRCWPVGLPKTIRPAPSKEETCLSGLSEL